MYFTLNFQWLTIAKLNRAFCMCVPMCVRVRVGFIFQIQGGDPTGTGTGKMSSALKPHFE